MASQEKVIAYGTTFRTYFLGMSTTLRVVSPVNSPSPQVDVVIHYRKDGYDRSVSLEGAFFENLLAMLASIRQHTELLTGAEFGFLASLTVDHQAILFGEVGPAQVKVFRKKGVLSGTRDVVQVIIGDLEIESELNDEFFGKIEHLRSVIEQAKRKIADKISAYISSKKV